MRIGDVLLADVTDDYDKNISEDDDSSSDSDRAIDVSETESDDTSTDEYISQDNDSDTSVSSSDEDNVHLTNQPEALEIDGVVWSMQQLQLLDVFVPLMY
ncbi:unnamed protein product [Didymodactylos carnosus]|uniref:Uncharacterized protein n=1 Tax=Didymodactylos carnosus TaxID=1234261 RepID=A0A815S978_9BILA|nr:unnamed protein product [Didymodactylos carnosus]CAF4352331.1 unnamed protein product [Didymodactylos carnosus]